MSTAANKLKGTVVLRHIGTGLDAAPVRRPAFLKTSHSYSIKSGDESYLFVVYR
jgi:hypothetical protein